MSTVYQNASTSISDLQTKPHCSSHSNPCLTVQSSSSIICFIFKFGKNILSYLQTFPPTSPFPPNPSLHQQEQGKGCRRPCWVWNGPDGASGWWWISHDGLGRGLYNRPRNSQASDGRLLPSLFSVTFHDQHWTPKSALNSQAPSGRQDFTEGFRTSLTEEACWA